MSEAPVKKETKPKAVKAVKPAKAAKAPAGKKEVVKCERKNGVARPKSGGKCAVVWEIADAISQKERRPAFRAEVMEAYAKKVPGGSTAMAATNYSLWSTFYGVGKELAKFKADARKEREAKEKQDKAEKKTAADAKRKEAEAKKKAASVAPEKKAA